MSCCDCRRGSKEKTEQRDKAYRQHDKDVVTKQPGRTASSGYLELSNSDQHCNNDDALSGAAVGTEPTGPDSSSKKNKAPDPPTQNITQTPGPTAQGRNSEGAVQDRQSNRLDAERQYLEERYQADTKELDRKLGAMKEENEKLEKSCQSDLDIASQEKEALETKINMIQKENDRLQNENVTYEVKLEKTKSDLERVEKEKKEMENAKNQLQAVLDSRSSKEKKKKELQKRYEDMKRSKEEVEQRLRESVRQNEHMIQAKEVQMVKLREEKKNLEMEKDELLVRLSALAGRKLTDNNPNIADLSDVNRPTKLAEKFSELYDNAWTDAFSEVQDLENFKDEEKTVTLLLELLKLAYNKAMKAAEDQLTSLKTTLEIFSGSDDTLVNDVLKQLKDSRKKITVPSKALEQEYRHALEQQEPEMLLKVKTLERYMKECLELCWLMAIQDPPLYFHTDGCRKGDIFDKNSFKEYTQGGYLVDFAVWPALFLQKGGSLLAKGVVQCQKTPDKSVQQKPTPTSLESSEDVMSKPEATKQHILTEENIAKDKAESIKEKFEPTIDVKKQDKADIREDPGSRASTSEFENLSDKKSMKGTVVLYENDEANDEKLKFAPEKTKNSTSVSSISQSEYEIGNAEKAVSMTDINQIKSETVSEVTTQSLLEAKDNTSSVPSSIASRPEFNAKRDSEKMQSTIIVQESVKSVERNPRNVSKQEDSHAADLKKDNTSTLEIPSTNPELPGKGNVKTKLAAFESQPSAQDQRQNSDNLPKTMKKDTVQRNSAPEMHAEPQKVESKQTQELKDNLSKTDDGKNVSSVDKRSSAKNIENLDSGSHAHTNKGPYVTKLATKDSKSDHVNLKQSEMIEAGVKSEPSEDKLDTPGRKHFAPKHQSAQKPKLSLTTKSVSESNKPQKITYTLKM